MNFTFRALCFVVLIGAPALATEQDALAIDTDIQAFHLPYGTILGPVYSSPDSSEIVSYSRCGDSATWTGHYLAAEAFRYAVTRSPDALRNATSALAGIRLLVDVTGQNLLARCAVPVESPYAPAILSEEASNGSWTGNVDLKAYYWIGHTSRDQYTGVFFGLAAAYDLIDDSDVRASARDLVTRLLDNLLSHNWAVVMPDGGISTVFWGRADQTLSFLQVGKHVNPDRFKSDYDWRSLFESPQVIAPIAFEVRDDHHSYFKFNLDTVNLYNLIRLEGAGYRKSRYQDAYGLLRRTTDDHGNAHFNMIDRALNGPNERRDAETRALLEAWLQRPRRDMRVDWRGVLPACDAEDRACAPIPVQDRVRTDFLWQRSPFLLYGGGEGNIATPGIDYILPYWMARYYGVLGD